MIQHKCRSRARSLPRSNVERTSSAAITLTIPPRVNVFSRCSEQLVHTRVEVEARSLRDVTRARNVPSIKTRATHETRSSGELSTFSERDPKLELHAYFAHGLATSLSIVRHRRRLRVECGSEFERGRGFRFAASYSVQALDARRRAPSGPRTICASAKDSTGDRSGPAKYHVRAGSKPRAFGRFSRASSTGRTRSVRSSTSRLRVNTDRP